MSRFAPLRVVLAIVAVIAAAAETAWRALLKDEPGNAEAYAHLGDLEARQEHYTEGSALYRKAFENGPAMTGLRLNLGLSLFKSGALKEAIPTFTPLLKSEPPSSPERLRLITLIGSAHYEPGDYAEAVPYLKQATAVDAQNLPFRLALAHNCLWSKQCQCGLDVYHEIFTLNAESAEADMLSGEALDEMKDNVGTTRQFRAAVKEATRLPDVHFDLGYVLWGLMQYEEAVQEFQAELADNPDHAQALAYLADTGMRLGRPQQAAPLLQNAIGINQRIELAHLNLGILWNDAGRKDDALRELKIAETLGANDQNVRWQLARFYQGMGREDEAKVEFGKTRNLHKAADEAGFKKLHGAQAKGKPADEASGVPAVN